MNIVVIYKTRHLFKFLFQQKCVKRINLLREEKKLNSLLYFLRYLYPNSIYFVKYCFTDTSLAIWFMQIFVLCNNWLISAQLSSVLCYERYCLDKHCYYLLYVVNNYFQSFVVKWHQEVKKASVYLQNFLHILKCDINTQHISSLS